VYFRIEHKAGLNFKQVGPEEVTIKLYFLQFYNQIKTTPYRRVQAVKVLHQK